MENISRVFDILEYQFNTYPQEKMITQKRNGKWESISSATFLEKTYLAASAFLRLKLSRGESIGIISEGRFEWNIVDFGSQFSGLATAPFYTNISKEDSSYVLKHSEVKMLFVSNDAIYQTIKHTVEEMNTQVVSFDSIPGVMSFEEFLSKGKKEDKLEIDKIKAQIKSDSLVTIIYTSGTTGRPKGVMLSHDNLMSNVISFNNMFPIKEGDRVFSFLPLNHIFERNVTNFYIYKGLNIYYAESMDSIGDNIREVKPHMMTAVPRVLEKIYLRILDRVDGLSTLKKKIFLWALRLAENYDIRDEHNSMSYKMQHAIVTKLVFSKWREAVGGDMRLIVCGAAPLLPKLTQIFTAAGIPIIEGYGLTETSPVVSFNRFFNLKLRKLGSVGVPLENVNVRLGSDNEIEVKGPNVMMGYYKNEEATRNVIDKDGWFRTGDIGKILDDQFLVITDRKKELFKTSGGKYIAPSYLEGLLKSCSLVEQSMVAGEGKHYVVALIVPNVSKLKQIAENLNLSLNTDREIIESPVILKMYQQEIDKINSHLNRYESIKYFKVLPDEWTVSGGEITPTLKLKRNFVKEKYASEIEELYTREQK